MELKAAIIEDETISRELLNKYISKYCPDVTVIAQAADVKQAQEVLEKTTVDIVFLDVEMPYGTAFDLLDKLESRDFEVIFVTAYDHYAKDALNQQAAYYLTKPIEIDELITAVDIVKTIKLKEQALTTPQNLVVKSKTINQDKITVPTQDGFDVLKIADIIYCKADDNYTHIILQNGKKLVSKTLKHFEELLTNKGFSRVHKSYLINTAYVTGYKKGKGGSVLLGEIELPVSSSKKIAFFECFE